MQQMGGSGMGLGGARTGNNLPNLDVSKNLMTRGRGEGGEIGY